LKGCQLLSERFMASKSSIKSDTKLNQFCLDIVKDYLDEDAKFEADINSSKEKSYHLSPASGNWATRMNAHGKREPVVRLNNGFYMSFSIGYKPQGNKIEFKNISLQFFDVDSLLFRAEWDNWNIKREESPEQEDIKKHPQPHWHLADNKKGRTDLNPVNSFTELVEQGSFNSFARTEEKPQEYDYSRLHFFMRMDGSNFPYYFDLTKEADFKLWLRETMKYVDHEFNCLKKNKKTI